MSRKLRQVSTAIVLLLVAGACTEDEAVTRAEKQKAREGVTLTSCHSDRVINKIMVKPVVTVKNTTDKRQNYTIVIHVIGEDERRLGKSNLIVTNLDPGKTVKRNASSVQITENSWKCEIKFVQPNISSDS